MTIKQAVRKVAAAYPEDSVSVQQEEWVHRYRGESRSRTEWCVSIIPATHVVDQYKCATLEDTVQSALEAADNE
jgi:hypothetical protein